MRIVVTRHAADDRQPVGEKCRARHQLADADAGDDCVDRLEFTPDFSRRIGLGIPRRMLRRATHEEENDTRFGGSVTDRTDGILFGGLRLAAQQVRERQPQRAESTDTENLAARDAIAQPSTAAVNAQHRVGPRQESINTILSDRQGKSNDSTSLRRSDSEYW